MILAVLACLFTAGEHARHDFTLTGPRGWTFDARLIEPSGERSGITVILIGGGIGNDLDWTIPGTIEVDNKPMPLTIDGTSHKDAPRIAQTLTDQGHAVLHYSTIAHEDPKRDRWPLEMTPHDVTDLLQLQRTATRAIQANPLTQEDRIVLLGHSMGGQRACAQAADDSDVQALVLLAPAQMTRTGPDDPGKNLNLAEARNQLARCDRDGDGTITGDEIPDAMDFDRDGILRAWEVAAAIARSRRQSMKTEQDADRHAIPFGEDSLRKRPVPTLILYGNLDEAQGHHAPILQDLIANGSLKTVEVRVLPGLGHQLGPERDHRIGPISTLALDQIVEWLETQQPKPRP